MTDKHTPGPWVVGNRYGSPGVFTSDGSLVASTHGEQRSIGRDELRAAQDANARLVAAAPEMMEALKQARDNLIGRRNVDAVDAAIAKAEGKDHDQS